MIPCSRRFAILSALVLTFLFASVAGSGAAVIVLRSGSVAPTAIDPNITYLSEPSNNCNTPFAALFTAADFAAADAGPGAYSVPAHPAWTPNLWCDPQTNWIATGPGWPPVSALYSVPFNVPLPEPCCIQRATLDFCWMSDDGLGDPAGDGPNALGVYINGVGLGIAGGNFTSAQRVIIDITALLHCGQNRLYVYNRDRGCAVAGANFSATIEYSECITPAHAKSWGAVRALYRD